MRKLWRLVVRVVFWSYERGSLPYDLMVIAILIFVLLTPRHWFNDQPSLHAPAAAGQIRLMGVDTKSNTEVFRIDASLLAPADRASELEKETHELLRRRVSTGARRGWNRDGLRRADQVDAFALGISPASSVASRETPPPAGALSLAFPML